MLVVDCSALVEVMLRSPNGLAVRSLFLDGEDVAAPDLLCAELASVYRKLALQGQLEAGEGVEFVRKSLLLVDELVPVDSLCVEALSESIRLDHSAYGFFYFVLARRLGATLASLDRKLNQLCEEQGVDHLREIEF